MSRSISTRARWAVPVVVAAVVAGGAQWSAHAAERTPDLPAISARDLLVKVHDAHVTALSGTVRSTAALGVPALPRRGGVDWSSLLSGTQTLRVYADGPTRQRVDLLGDLAQATVVHDGRTLWTWSSQTKQVTRTMLPTPTSASADKGAGSHDQLQPPLTPQAAADRALAAVTPTTTVTVGRSATVAGRSAYDLSLVPHDPTSLVGSAQVFVDSATGLVLRTVVTPRSGGDPAVDIGFTRLSLAAPAASTFRFTPPPGSSVRDVTAPSGTASRHATSRPTGTPPARTIGTGWATVVESTGSVPTAAVTRGDRSGISQTLLRAARPVSGRFGTGQLLSTRLLTVLQTADGRVFAGAVTPSELLRVADAAGTSR